MRKSTDSALRRSDAAGSGGRCTLRVVPLPDALPEEEDRLHAVAARLLRHSHVRSVSIDRASSEATIRLHADGPVAWGDEALSAMAAGEDAVDSTPPVSWIDARTGNLCFIKRPAQIGGWRRALLRAAAAAALVLALLGVLLPGLPTTPFVLLASYCLLRTSPALHERLLHGRLFGGVLRDWHLHRGIRPHVRVKAVALVALMVAASLLLTNRHVPAMLAIGALAAFGIWYVWRLPTLEENEE